MKRKKNTEAMSTANNSSHEAGEGATNNMTTARVSRLLSLPAELRNRIYEFALQSMSLRNYRVYLVYGEAAQEQQEIVPPAKSSDWFNESRMFYGLTQTCRQLRSEFRPLHQACLKVCIKLAQLEHYIEDYTPEVQTNPLEASGHIATYASFDLEECSIASLIRTLSESPNVVITTGPCWDDLELELHAKSMNPIWWSYFNEKVQDVHVLRTYLVYCHIKVFLKSHFYESWMRKIWKFEEEGFPFKDDEEMYECAEAKREWLEEINLSPDDLDLKICCLGADW